jgi:hypothetical protein
VTRKALNRHQLVRIHSYLQRSLKDEKNPDIFSLDKPSCKLMLGIFVSY